MLISTFCEGDDPKVLEAMRRLPYERLVLIGEEGMTKSASFEKIRAIEELAGQEVALEVVTGSGFMGLVDEIASILGKYSKDPVTGERPRVLINISGGSKMLGDAALFAAFRAGVEACHCDNGLTMLPVLRGATAIDRFTPSQVRFIRVLGRRFVPLDDIAPRLDPQSRQAAERVMRELRKLGLLRTKIDDGRIMVALSETGSEVSRALRRQAGS
jgi:hypothetical protein